MHWSGCRLFGAGGGSRGIIATGTAVSLSVAPHLARQVTRAPTGPRGHSPVDMPTPRPSHPLPVFALRPLARDVIKHRSPSRESCQAINKNGQEGLRAGDGPWAEQGAKAHTGADRSIRARDEGPPVAQTPPQPQQMPPLPAESREHALSVAFQKEGRAGHRERPAHKRKRDLMSVRTGLRPRQVPGAAPDAQHARGDGVISVHDMGRGRKRSPLTRASHTHSRDLSTVTLEFRTYV